MQRDLDNCCKIGNIRAKYQKNSRNGNASWLSRSSDPIMNGAPFENVQESAKQKVFAEKMFQMIPIVLAHECSCVVAEGKRLVATCFSCTSRLPLIPKSNGDELFEKCLTVLCRQAETRLPQFSAAGFFTIDYSMLASMAGCLTANMIIILQFVQSNRNRA
ncbi:hypothetical protein WA026_002928 [Henosepilachna vigintioctopunctata]|uniref:Uncharacterized protein n=1 Tax=Henosepilachna vigintioctopunctata TaxID=420089 RepID=A0AAW1THP9_9CUCU